MGREVEQVVVMLMRTGLVTTAESTKDSKLLSKPGSWYCVSFPLTTASEGLFERSACRCR